MGYKIKCGGGYELDPITGAYGKAQRPEDNIELMNRMPARSCWIKFLQNRVSLTSVGNVRYAKEMWFDYTTKMVSESRDGEDAVHFRSYILPGAGKPAGWIYVKNKF